MTARTARGGGASSTRPRNPRRARGRARHAVCWRARPRTPLPARAAFVFLLAATASLLAACGKRLQRQHTPTVSPSRPPRRRRDGPFPPRGSPSRGRRARSTGRRYPSIEAECATADLPAQRTAPELGTPIAICRIGAGAPATAQLWCSTAQAGRRQVQLAAYAAMARAGSGRHLPTSSTTAGQASRRTSSDRAFRQARTNDG